MRKTFRKVLLNQYLHALIFSLVIIILLPDLFNKYKVDLVEKNYIHSIGGTVYIQDLNSDGNYEKIIAFKESFGGFSFQVFDKNYDIIDQWNYKGKYYDRTGDIYFGDIDKDGFLEIYGFTSVGDSVFLNSFEPFAKNKTEIKKKFITTVGKHGRVKDYRITDFKIADLNNDSLNEIFFVIGAGFSLEPRKFFSYNVFTDSLISSLRSGSIPGNPSIIDVNNDNKLEIIGTTGAAQNIPDSMQVPFKDDRAWLMAYDCNLNLLFGPVEFNFNRSWLFHKIIKDKGEFKILVFHRYNNDEGFIDILKYTARGELTDRNKLLLGTGNKSFELYYFGNDSSKVLFVHKNGYHIINSNLEITKTVRQKNIDLGRSKLFDLNNDGIDEIISICEDFSGVLINSLNLKHITKIEVEDDGKTIGFKLKVVPYSDDYLVLIQKGSYYYVYNYSLNYLFYFKYLFYLIIYLTVWGIIWFIRYIQYLQLKEKENLKNKILELQLKSVNNQLDPHFTYNAFTSIASVLKKAENKSLYEVFMKFTNLTRSALISSDKVFRTLEDEMIFVNDYLDIEKYRFENRFDYEIKVEKDVDFNVLVPKMLIQVHTENAVKHGLSGIKENGKLIIHIVKIDDSINILIEDNGIGRKASNKLPKKSTGLGIKLIEEYFYLYEKNYNKKLKQEIVDLYDENSNSIGTRVIITIPILKN